MGGPIVLDQLSDEIAGESPEFVKGYAQALKDIRSTLQLAAERFMFEDAAGLNLRPVIYDFERFLESHVRELLEREQFVELGLGI